MESVLFATVEQAGVFGGDVRGYATEESDQARSPGEAEVCVGVENILERFQQRVMIERSVGDSSGFEELGE